MRSDVLALAILTLAACGKKADDSGSGTSTSAGSAATGSAATGSASTGSGTGPASPSTTPPPKSGGSKFAYPPPGAGPHEGFDLAAIHAKLQGSWLTGGSAFSSIPNVWSLDGDTLTQVGEDGKRSTSTLRLLTPCYFVAGSPDGSSGTYSHFVFDGDTLYLGLGASGLTVGDRTLGCMAVGMYVLQNGTCTRWTKKSFSKPGNEWESEPGVCGFTEDGKQFTGDDTTSKRKIYGVEKLEVHGGVLMTKQMAGNKAERFASLEAAIAKQKELVDAKFALTQTPTDLPFKDWGVESVAPTYEANTTIWAAAVGRDGTWALGTGRYKKFEVDAVWVSGMRDAWAPSAFVHVPDAGAIKPGASALLGIGALMPYGRVVKVDGDKVIVQYKSGNQVAEKPLERDRVLPLAKGAWAFGAPIAIQVDGSWQTGRVVLDAGDEAYVFNQRAVTKVAKADVRLIDVGKRWSKGAKVWAMQSSGMSPLRFVEGKIEKVHGDGTFYTIKADAKIFDQAYDAIVGKL